MSLTATKLEILVFFLSAQRRRSFFWQIFHYFRISLLMRRSIFFFLFILKLQIVTERTAATRNRTGCSLTTHYLYLMN